MSKHVFIRKQKTVQAVPQWRSAPSMIGAGSKAAENISWSGENEMKTLLLIDPDAEHLSRQSDLLGRAGYRTVTARDGMSALFILESGMLLDLIVTEYWMPDMDSREFLAAVRKEAPAVPVVVATSNCSVEGYLHALSTGVYEYLSKPLHPDVLHSIVRAAVEARRAGNPPAGMASL